MIIIMLPSITPGMAVGFSAIALPELTNLSLDETAWFGNGNCGYNSPQIF